MWNGFSKSSNRRGLTLVEVIAGLMLLATLLTAVLAGFKAHSAQIRSARDRLRAHALLEDLLNGWTSQGALPEVGAQKVVADTEGWRWRVLADDQQSEQVNIGSVRVEIVRSRDPGGDEALASVSLVVPGSVRLTK